MKFLISASIQLVPDWSQLVLIAPQECTMFIQELVQLFLQVLLGIFR